MRRNETGTIEDVYQWLRRTFEGYNRNNAVNITICGEGTIARLQYSSEPGFENDQSMREGEIEVIIGQP